MADALRGADGFRRRFTAACGLLVVATVVGAAACATIDTDPTHVDPIPPERLRFAVEAAGFERSRTLFQARVPPGVFAGPDAKAYYMDYAIIAYRRPR